MTTSPVLSRKLAKRLRIPVLPDEEIIIRNNAKQAGLATAVYLRRLALGYQCPNIIDKLHVSELAKINADLGRLGGLLKMWLTNDERLKQIKPETIHLLLKKIEQTQEDMLSVVKRL